MNRLEFIFEYSPWLILLCILTGAFYSYLLYTKKSIWSKNLNYVLAGSRFLLVFLLSVLLLVPMIKQLKNFIEEPTLAFMVDNSQSIKSESLVHKLKESEVKLAEAGYEIKWYTLNGSVDKLEDLKFEGKTTNLSKPIKELENNFINRNLTATVLISDGIHNQGFSPEYLQTNSPIITVGLGDTTTPKDISIQEVFYNKIVYSGNKFPVKVRLLQSGFDKESATVSIKKGDKVIQSKNIDLNNKAIHEIEFLLESASNGKQQYSIEIETKENESSIENNNRDIYVQVIDGKERILIYAASPHPDIKTIRAALESKDNLETTVYYDGFSKKPKGLFDLVIAHQYPSSKIKKDKILNDLIKDDTPVWYFIGNGSDVKAFNESQNGLNIVQQSNNNDQVFGSLNTNFKGFTLESESLKNLSKLPPIDIRFAQFNFNGKVENLILQQIGSVVSKKPLMSIVEKSNGVKNAYFLADGLWKWRLQEYSINENTNGIDELIQKTVRYITSKKDKRQLRVNPVKEEFFSDEGVQMDVEVYNDIYEKVYQKEISITVKKEDETKQFSFVNDAGNSRFNLGQLDKGLYSFVAKTSINGKTVKDEGSFVVKEQYLEKITSKADFGLLQRVSKNTGGEFYEYDDFDKLVDKLISTEHKPKIVLTDETLKELINQKWLFFLLILLVTVEWAARKFQGDY